VEEEKKWPQTEKNKRREREERKKETDELNDRGNRIK
jgi:hypothetical protein